MANNSPPKTPDPCLSKNAVAVWLAQTGAYPHRPATIEHIETHISHVFLAGDLVYKLKKPVRFDFLDFSTLAARERACRDEVRLNQRLAPDVYLGVVPVTRSAAGNLALDGEGEAIDWLVAMRRLPTDLTLDALSRRGQLTPQHIERLAKTLNRFYRSLPPLRLPPGEYRDRYLAHVRDNRRLLLSLRHHLPPRDIERIHGFQQQLLLRMPELLEARASAGKIVDGHGDLRPEHICFGEEIAIFDCIEFSADFRRIDIADELAFLAAECDFLGARWVGPQLLASYKSQSGDAPSNLLVAFYKSYRACVRAKVAALRADQLAGETQATAARDAQQHLSLADEYASPWLRPLVLAVGGIAGTGKTTLAKAIADALGAELLRTDVIRREPFAVNNEPATADGGIYSPAARQQVYDRLLGRAQELHADRISVVLDGTFSSLESLASAQSVAGGAAGAFLAIECTCRPEIAHERIRQRLSEGRDASEARPEIHDLQRQRWQTWPADVPQIRIDTEQPLAQQVEQVLQSLAADTGPQANPL